MTSSFTDVRSFENKVALVTGGASGIGRAACLAFTARGARVACVDIDREGGEETVRRIEAAGGEGLFLHFDVTGAPAVEKMVADTVAAFGRLDYAHNNAGILGAAAPIADYSEDDWDLVLATNLKAIFLGMKHEIPAMLATGGGAIVNSASVASFHGHAQFSAYVASKHGVVGLTKTAALEYAGQGIRVNGVCPGLTRTPMTERALLENPDVAAEMEAMLVSQVPLGRMGMPEELAAAVVWLCSDEAAFVNGQMMIVDGGRLAS